MLFRSLDIVTFFYVLPCFNMIYRSSDIPRSTRAILKFQNLRSLLKIAQRSVRLRYGFDGCMLGLNLYRQQWEAAWKFALC